MMYLEFAIPRMGHRVDAVVLIKGIVLAIEFKIDAKEYFRSDIDQAYDYAIDLKYFHEASHNLSVVPILVASRAKARPIIFAPHARVSGLYQTICTNAEDLASTINRVISQLPAECVDPAAWEASRYCPTPTIIEAARALYAGHGVADISRNDAGAINLRDTSEQLVRIIDNSKSSGQKAICFVTGVPGAGKTLVGLNIATKYNDPKSELHSVFLSGNGPLVAILREALARDTIRRECVQGKRLTKGNAMARVKAFIQNVHHFRDECLLDRSRPPVDHVALFDEAQRAWDQEQTTSFMRRKKGVTGFNVSEPEFLISCMDRRNDWAVIVCLVGGGQEINTGEAGIGEWIEAVQRAFGDWHLYLSPALTDSEYGAGKLLEAIRGRDNVHYLQELHLGVSMRSFRAETVSAFVKLVLDCEIARARDLLKEFECRYPIVLTRKLDLARQWLRDHASGSERFGIVVSSQAERLKPYAIDVRTPVDPVKWFLDGKDDVRSSYYLEDVATEFHVQGLELDWVCVSWDGDFRYNEHGWQHLSFRGTKWQRINKASRKIYLKNAYRVLLTRARQGMVIFIPEGSTTDPTRHPSYYDSTYAYLRSVGLREL
jgi:schlafen family protein